MPPLELSEYLSNPDVANGSGLGLEIIVSRDGRLPESALLTLGPELREALQDPASVEARRVAIRDGGVDRYRIQVRGLNFGIEIEPASDPSAREFICLKHRILVEQVDEGAASPADRSVLDELPLAITVADRGGRIRYVNEAARTLVGGDPDVPLIGESIWQFVHPEGLDDAHRVGWQVRMGQMAMYERHLLRRLDGSRIPVETTTQRISWGGEESILVASHDLSGVEDVERALEESQRLFSSIFHIAPIAIVVSRNSDSRFIDVNPAFLRYLGMERSEVVGKSLKELGVEYDRDVIEGMRADLVSGRGGELIEANLKGADGAPRTLLCSAAILDVQGEPCMLTIGTDITELRRATRLLQESERRFRLMADAAPVLIWLSDVEGRRTFVNRQWLEFVGSSMEAELGRGWLSSVHPDDREHCLAVVDAALSREEGFSMEYRLRRYDGSYRWVLDRGTLRRDTGGDFTGYIGSCTDITDRREGEERLREAKERAEEMTILKSAFLTNMTHEIRTPLTVILGFTTILRQGTRPEYQRFISLIERSGRRLLLMLDSILDLAQLEAGTLVPEFSRYNVADIANGVAEALRPIAEEKNIELTVRVTGESFVAETDHAVISRVLNNLIDNAVKFTEDGAVDILIASDGEEVRLEIRDTGIGIHEDFLPRIFDAFSQESTGLARTHQGSGLGLTVSAQLIHLVGGNLTVKSEKGVGSTIIIRLPRLSRRSTR